MQSLFNKRHTNKSEINQIFSLPPTNIIHVQPQPLPPISHEPQQMDEEENPRQTQQQRQEKLTRTIFIGNVKIDTNKKELKKLLLPFGKIEKIWYKSVPVQHSKMGPKASFILRKFQQNAESMNAYARFEDVQEANSALQLNGRVFNDLTLRVSSAGTKEQDFEKTIFIGNLPFDIKQEELRKFFNKIGTIQNVRIIRNKFSHQGIGIGYVMFSRQDEMKKAIAELNGSELRGRNLRIKKAVEKKRLEKKKRKFIDQKEVNRNAALQRLQQKNQQYEQPEPQQSYKHQSNTQQRNQQPKQVQSQDQSKSQPKTQSKSQPKETKQVQNNSVPKASPQPKQTKANKKQKVPLSEKKKPHVVQQDTQQDKVLRNEVNEQLKLLKRKMIHKNK